MAETIQIREKSQLMSASEIDRTLVRLAHEILEKAEDIYRRGIRPARTPGVFSLHVRPGGIHGALCGGYVSH